METSTGSTSASINNNEEDIQAVVEKMQVDPTPQTGEGRLSSNPLITVSAESGDNVGLAMTTKTSSPARDRKKSPGGVSPRQRKRSQPVRGELLPDPDKLLSYKHHDKKEEEELEDPSFPGGQPKPPPEPRAPGQPAERKRSTVTFCPVVQTIEK